MAVKFRNKKIPLVKKEIPEEEIKEEVTPVGKNPFGENKPVGENPFGEDPRESGSDSHDSPENPDNPPEPVYWADQSQP